MRASNDEISEKPAMFTRDCAWQEVLSLMKLSHLKGTPLILQKRRLRLFREFLSSGGQCILSHVSVNVVYLETLMQQMR